MEESFQKASESDLNSLAMTVKMNQAYRTKLTTAPSIQLPQSRMKTLRGGISKEDKPVIIPKRGRGRPRKVRPNDNSQSSNLGSASEVSLLSKDQQPIESMLVPERTNYGPSRTASVLKKTSQKSPKVKIEVLDQQLSKTKELSLIKNFDKLEILSQAGVLASMVGTSKEQ